MDYILGLFGGELSWLDVVIRVIVAVFIGMGIGVERELANHPAGMKTHALVCLTFHPHSPYLCLLLPVLFFTDCRPKSFS